MLSEKTLSFKARPDEQLACKHCKKITTHVIRLDPNCVVKHPKQDPPERGAWLQICTMCGCANHV